jgi:hypothetical protein
MKMTKEQFAQFRAEIESALAPIAAKYGTKAITTNIKYDDITTDVMVSFRTETAEKSAEQFNFEKYCRDYGFGPTDYGFEFEHQGKRYTFTSFRPTARKYPCICACSDGKDYAFTPETVRVMMAMVAKGEE